jgi:hypothetical protein
MATPPPQRSVFSLLLRQLDTESLLGGLCGERGLACFLEAPGFWKGGWKGAQWPELFDWGWGGLDGLSLGHWASLVRGRPPFSLWSSFTAVASKAPSHRPSACSSSVRLVPSPTDKWSGLALFPASPSSGQGQRGSKRGKAEGGSKREADTETLAREGDRGSKLDRCSSPETSSPGEGATLRGVTEEPLGESLPLPQQSWWC